MANPENLKPPQSTAEARERGRKGGIASGESKRRKKELKGLLETLLETVDEKSGKSVGEALVVQLVKQGLNGNIKAFECIRDTVYGKPVSTIEMTGKGGTPLQPPAINVNFVKPDGR